MLAAAVWICGTVVGVGLGGGVGTVVVVGGAVVVVGSVSVCTGRVIGAGGAVAVRVLSGVPQALVSASVQAMMRVARLDMAVTLRIPSSDCNNSWC